MPERPARATWFFSGLEIAIITLGMLSLCLLVIPITQWTRKLFGISSNWTQPSHYFLLGILLSFSCLIVTLMTKNQLPWASWRKVGTMLHWCGLLGNGGALA